MREITTHQVNDCNAAIKLTVLDEPGSGGANHHYRMEFDDPKFGPDPLSMHQTRELYFQNGPIKEVGTNGITQEVLLAIVADRLQSFQKGPYACRENALAQIVEAIHWLHHRTAQRVSRGVEGTHAK